MIDYLRRHSGLASNRPSDAPLLVVFDWETSDQDYKRAVKAYGPGGEFHVVRMNQRWCDPQLGPDFKGIERFYPPKVFLDAHAAGELVLGVSSGKPYSVSFGQLESAKAKLLRRVKELDDPKVLEPLVKVVRGLERIARGEQFFQQFLPGMEAPEERGRTREPAEG